ncbi:MAG: O-methyltransferase [Polyangiales bacterium]
MADNTSRSGVTYASGELLEYLQRTHVTHDAGLLQAFDAPGREGIPAIQVGPSEGKTLQLMMRMIGAKKVVEVGTLAGYSAIHLACGLAPGGHLWSIEFEKKHAEIARRALQTAGVADRVTVLEGAGLDVLPTLEQHGPFDAVFIDADKANYDQYGRWAAKHTRAGGLLLGDNAFFFGKLLEDSPPAASMRRFHEEARQHYDTVCMPTPDGLLLGVHK